MSSLRRTALIALDFRNRITIATLCCAHSTDLMRERSLRYVFPDVSTKAHLEHTVGLVASSRIRMKPTITHILEGIDSVPQAFEITGHKAKY